MPIWVGEEFPVLLRSSNVPQGDDDQPLTRCLSCGELLEVHQPDADLPERMLGTCDSCKAWHLVDSLGPGAGANVVLLPNFAQLRKARNLRRASSLPHDRS